VWWDINQSDTLNARVAKDEEAEVHLCPLQLPVIERCIRMYSNPGDVVFTPFLGIGSEVYQAIKMGRKGIGIELKPSYFDTAVQNIKNAETEMRQTTLF
jgi:DNA modification methylase